MKNICLLFLLLSTLVLTAQDKTGAEKKVDEGVGHHDKGEYDLAIIKYNEALVIDKDNLLALAEKALTLISLKKFEESIDCCKLAIARHPGDNGLRNVYVTY